MTAVAVEGLVLRTCTPHTGSPSCTFVVLYVLCDSRVASGLIAAKGGDPGSNLWGSSKLPSFQTSKLPMHALNLLKICVICGSKQGVSYRPRMAR